VEILGVNMKETTKQTIKNTLLIVSLVGAVLAFFAIRNARQDRMMDAYARANNCTWYATGSAYGDNRDFICK
jgi:hypothetical protein